MSKLKLQATDGSAGTVSLKAPVSTTGNAEFELTLPGNAGSNGQLLSTNGSGVLSWSDDNSGVSLSGSTNNTIATVSGANALVGEANLTYDGDILSVGTGSGGAIVKVVGAEGGAAELWLQCDDGDDNADNWLLYHNASDNKLNFANKTSGSYVDKLSLETGGNVKINDGDLVIGTAGHGIDFSANSHAGGMTSELLDSYEEGTWTPTLSSGMTADGLNNLEANRYIRIGKLVHCGARFTLTNTSGNFTVGDGAPFGGLPFNPSNNALGSCGSWWTSNAWTSGTRATGNIMAHDGSSFYLGVEYASGMARSVVMHIGVTYRIA